MRKTVKIPLLDITLVNPGYDCGMIVWKCPDCFEQVTWAPDMWWIMECGCRKWNLDIKIKGDRK